MQAVVPAAGEGTRMRPLTANRPKGLVEVAGDPLLAHVFDTLRPVVEECVVVTGYQGDQIVERFGHSYRGLELTYVRQSERRGLADALLQAESHIDGSFISLNGDNVLRADLGGLVARHRETGADAAAFVERVSWERAREGAVLELTAGPDASDVEGVTDRIPEQVAVTGVVEKPEEPPSRYIPRGCYVLSPAVFDACRLVTPGSTGERELTDAVDLLLAAGRRFETVPLDGWCHNLNTPADRDRVARRLDGADD
ncbi:MAG: dTDP-glucose pyrophosphorylase [halophilic archaeon J07HX64]|jgi:dTDP-glucose pyrophosphorylase|nr:MAG: dTDP-glucose pyrophosphorylase [halophilic archaeon J07HX64]